MISHSGTYSQPRRSGAKCLDCADTARAGWRLEGYFLFLLAASAASFNWLLTCSSSSLAF